MSATARQLADALREIEHLRQRIAALEAAGRGAPSRGFARIATARLITAIPGREEIAGEAGQYYLHTAAARLIDLAIDGTWPDGSERVRMRDDGTEEVLVLNPWPGATEANSEVVIGELPNGLWTILGEGHVRFWRYTLNEAMGATTANQAAADLLTLAGTDTTTDVVIRDPLAMFADQVVDSAGYCLQVGSRYYAIQGPCATAA